MAAYDGVLYFSAFSELGGRELWAIRIDWDLFADGFESGDKARWAGP